MFIILLHSTDFPLIHSCFAFVNREVSVEDGLNPWSPDGSFMVQKMATTSSIPVL